MCESCHSLMISFSELDASEALLSFKNGRMSSNSDIKDEPSEEEFCPASLGLHRVGESLPPKPQASQPPALNRRGMVRIMICFDFGIIGLMKYEKTWSGTCTTE